jgi:Holliday junction resolvase RusA-like endonuclease
MDVLTSPNDLVFDLPYPPSVNRIWRSGTKNAGGKVHLAPSYIKWRDAAGGLLMTQRGWMQRRISGSFSAYLALCPPKGHPRGDLDNRIKAVLDFLERSTIISSDKHCQLVCAYWVDRVLAPEGCRVAVKPWGPQSVNEVLRAAVSRLEASPVP